MEPDELEKLRNERQRNEELASFSSNKRDRMESDTQESQPLIRPTHRRRSSISDALDKFIFPKRRTTNDTTFSTSTVVPPSRLPTPAGVSRSSSFFRNLGPFSSKPPEVPAKDARAASVTVKHAFSPPESQVPASKAPASTPYSGHQQRNQSVEIPQHGLMQPIRPGVPRSTTVGNLNQQGRSDHRPSFMRSTSSSARRQTLSSGQNLSSGLGLPSSSRQFHPAPRSSTGPAMKEMAPQQEQPKAQQHSFKPSNTLDDVFSLSPAKEEDEGSIEYATDEEIEIGVATKMTITPIRSVSSHNPYSENNFAYGTPRKYDIAKGNSDKPFEHLMARPVPFDLTPTRIQRKPLPALTPDRSKNKQADAGHSKDIDELTHGDSAEYYRRCNSKPLERSNSDLLLDLKDDYNAQTDSLLGAGTLGVGHLPRSDTLQGIYKPEDVFFADEAGNHSYEEEETVVHTVDGQLIKGSFASASSSEAGPDTNDGANDEGDNNDLTTSTITAPPRHEADPTLVSPASLFPLAPLVAPSPSSSLFPSQCCSCLTLPRWASPLTLSTTPFFPATLPPALTNPLSPSRSTRLSPSQPGSAA